MVGVMSIGLALIGPVNSSVLRTLAHGVNSARIIDRLDPDRPLNTITEPSQKRKVTTDPGVIEIHSSGNFESGEGMVAVHKTTD